MGIIDTPRHVLYDARQYTSVIRTSNHLYLALFFQLQHPRQNVRSYRWSVCLLALLMGLHGRHAGIYCIQGNQLGTMYGLIDPCELLTTPRYELQSSERFKECKPPSRLSVQDSSD